MSQYVIPPTTITYNITEPLGGIQRKGTFRAIAHASKYGNFLGETAAYFFSE